METVRAQITDFLNKCEELKNCKFIMATTKIKDLLKSIVNSPELYELFNTVANGFDYPAMKQRCFIDSGNCRVVLPDTVGERLAFIFCLLVEFDRNDINFNAFLQKYYPKDGSYFSSYHLFCDEVIGSLESIICDVFSKELAPQPPELIAESSEGAAQVGHNADNGLALILVNAEKEAVSLSTLTQEDKEGALIILNALENAVLNYDMSQIQSLACGYNYFVLYTNFVSDSLDELVDELTKIVG